MTSVQVRLPEQIIGLLDNRITKGEFKSRSDAIRTILAFYEDREKTLDLYKELMKRSKMAQNKKNLILFEDL